MWPKRHDYERGAAVRRALWRYERACRLLGRPSSGMWVASRVSHIEGKPRRPLEEHAAFVADMERLLCALEEFDRAVLVLVGQRGLSETLAAKRLHTYQARVSRCYWRAVLQTYQRLVAAKYVEATEEIDAETSATSLPVWPSKAGQKPRMAAMGLADK